MSTKWPQWVKQKSTKIAETWDENPPSFPPALDINPTKTQVVAWLDYQKQIIAPLHAGDGWNDEDTERDVDDVGIDDGEADSVLSDLLQHEEDEEEEVKRILAWHPPTEESSNYRLRNMTRLMRSLQMSTVSLPLPKPSPPSSPRLARSDNAPSITPAKGRSHPTARKYLCAFLLANKFLCCAISREEDYLECAHLVSIKTSKEAHRRMEYAIGGRFDKNSRMQYILLKHDSHRDLDALNRVLIYIVEPHVLEAISTYLDWLDSKDGGSPSKQLRIVDYFARLRKAHPTLSDGHRYKFRYIATSDIPKPTRVVLESDEIFRPPFEGLPLGVTFSNPLFITLNAIQHVEQRFAVTWEDWCSRRDKDDWATWIQLQPMLCHLAKIPVGSETAVEEFAAFLTVAAHLRRRMEKNFRWELEKAQHPVFGSLDTQGSGDDRSAHDGDGSRRRGGRGGGGNANSGSLGGRDGKARSVDGGRSHGLKAAGRAVLGRIRNSEGPDGSRTPANALAAEWRENNKSRTRKWTLSIFKPSNALAAYERLDKKSFQGRLVHILAAVDRVTKFEVEKGGGRKKNVKREKNAQRKAAAGTEFNWSMLYMNSDAVASSIVDRMRNLRFSTPRTTPPSNSHSLKRTSSKRPSRIWNRRAFFWTHFLPAVGHDYPERIRELFEPHGALTRVLVPPAGTAVVEFARADEAGVGFRAVAYRRLGNSVVYLEKGPLGMFGAGHLPMKPDPTRPDQLSMGYGKLVVATL
ncbi:hypothetical protein DFH07DRAFT_1057785 [Mycena maculata]|uniref:Uncharacterized protein n=1 Tax=Mycena maculata TaxID=230809 RepID=A0AAD7JSW2_9AGAR|nr:hypothetical protein DFH07DRAFT_1057785 [Mycena maculata]